MTLAATEPGDSGRDSAVINRGHRRRKKRKRNSNRKKGLARLQVVQNSAARQQTRSNRGTHITIFKAVTLAAFRALHGKVPFYVTDLIQPYSSSCNLSSSNQKLLVVS
ncbi:hypothetical protein ATANTOWER_027676 [Ataeniobius toweri]|uniref:Uncharacterized protein n=1 Tax=Ataeniobius toweri TaxID=208326 RepID=A0ABU7B1F6_9TELE|nr:hypothetical protein [Ataeniobius toweri]